MNKWPAQRIVALSILGALIAAGILVAVFGGFSGGGDGVHFIPGVGTSDDDSHGGGGDDGGFSGGDDGGVR